MATTSTEVPRTLAALTGAVLLAAAAYWLAKSLGSSHASTRTVLAFSVLIFAAVMFHAATDRRAGYAMVTCTLYLIFLFAIPGMLHSAMNRFPFYARTYGDADTLKAAYVSLLFAVFLALGYLSLTIAGDATPRAAPIVRGAERHLHRRPPDYASVLWLAWLFLGLSTVAIVVLGPNNFMQNRTEISGAIGGQIDSESSGLLLALISVPRVIAFVALLCAAFMCFRIYRRGCWPLLIAAILVNTVVNYPLALPRFILFGFILTTFAVLWRTRAPIFNKLLYIFGFTGGILTIFPLVSFLTRGDEFGTFSVTFLSYYSGHGDFDGFQSLTNVVMYASEAGFRWGRQIISAVLAFVPRALWHGKSEPTGALGAEYMGYPYLNISAPLPAEFFLDFGWIGVMVGAFIVGRYVRVIDRSGPPAQIGRNLFVLLRYGGVVGFAVIVLRGSLLAIAPPVVTYFGTIEIMAFLCTSRLFSLDTKTRYEPQRHGSAQMRPIR